MTSTIDTLGKATRHGLVLRVECLCGNRRDFAASDLMMRVGGGRDPLRLRFRCTRCRPKVTMMERAAKSDASSIRELIESRYSVYAHCERFNGRQCGHHGAIDLAVLRNKLGAEFKLSHATLTPLLRCRVCGTKEVSIRIMPYPGA